MGQFSGALLPLWYIRQRGILIASGPLPRPAGGGPMTFTVVISLIITATAVGTIAVSVWVALRLSGDMRN
jgi:hypothetical protein